jgi:hypothetical protein
VEWLALVVLVMLVVLGIGGLVWRDRRRGPVCPWCGTHGTFGDDGNAEVCSRCGFDWRSDDH